MMEIVPTTNTVASVVVWVPVIVVLAIFVNWLLDVMDL